MSDTKSGCDNPKCTCSPCTCGAHCNCGEAGACANLNCTCSPCKCGSDCSCGS